MDIPSVDSIIFDNETNIQDHYLTIHKASPGAYTCKLISTSMEVIGTLPQHAVTESECMLLRKFNSYH